MHHLQGQRFGRLVCLSPTDKRDHGIIWHCQCDCGNTVDVSSYRITSGNVKSCGCFQKESRYRDITGRRSGSMVAIRPTTERDNRGSTVWEWRCDCGNMAYASIEESWSGRTMCEDCAQKLKQQQALAMEKRVERAENTNVSKLVAQLKHGKPARNNTSGVTGVMWHSRLHKWVARISFQKKAYSLGCYDRIEDAITARKQAEQRYHAAFVEEYNKRKKPAP